MMAGNISMMAAFAGRLEQLAKSDPEIRVLTADLVGSCGLKEIERNHPGQFINVGIAEQNMVGIAAGLAHEGMRPYTYTFAAFHSMPGSVIMWLMKKYDSVRRDTLKLTCEPKALLGCGLYADL